MRWFDINNKVPMKVTMLNHRRRVKKSLVVAFGNRCFVCHNRFSYPVYEFHHINPKEKLFGICDGSNKVVAQVCNECYKCVMLCPNCHRKITYGDLKIKGLKSNFNKKVYLASLRFLRLDYDLLVKKEKELQNRQAKEMHRIAIQESRPNRDELKYMIRHNSFVDIGKEYSVTDNSVRKWCKKLNLPYRKKDINSISDDVWDSL